MTEQSPFEVPAGAEIHVTRHDDPIRNALEELALGGNMETAVAIARGEIAGRPDTQEGEGR